MSQTDSEKLERVKMAFECALYEFHDRDMPDSNYWLGFEVTGFLGIFETLGIETEPQEKPISDIEQFVLGAIETGAMKVIDDAIDKWLSGEYNMDRDYTVKRITELKHSKATLQEMIDRLRIFYGGNRLYKPYDADSEKE